MSLQAENTTTAPGNTYTIAESEHEVDLSKSSMASSGFIFVGEFLLTTCSLPTFMYDLAMDVTKDVVVTSLKEAMKPQNTVSDPGVSNDSTGGSHISAALNSGAASGAAVGASLVAAV